MSWNLVPLAGVAASPWKNGGGVTQVLFTWPAAGDWRVRISVAQVAQDGLFSRFEGIRRWFAVLDGAGVKLQVEGREHVITPESAPLEFDGGAQTECRLTHGPTRDFNLMTRDSPALLRRVRGSLKVQAKATMLVAAYAHAQPARVAFAGDQGADIPAFTLGWRILDANGPIRLSGDGALWMEAVL